MDLVTLGHRCGSDRGRRFPGSPLQQQSRVVMVLTQHNWMELMVRSVFGKRGLSHGVHQ